MSGGSQEGLSPDDEILDHVEMVTELSLSCSGYWILNTRGGAPGPGENLTVLPAALPSPQWGAGIAV